ncbi:MAG TPA: response regulator transcription factor [Gemmatimonadales bacterium]|nr:response regulator transcription factor [Gemmatimonadales bacterium]
MSGERPRLVIADDHRVVVQGLQQLLGTRFDIVGVAYAGDELLKVLEKTPSDGLLLDLSLPGRNGLDILPEIRALQPDLKVLVLTMHADRVLAEASIAAGALGFVPKDAGTDELELALQQVLAGRRYVSPRVPKSSHRVSLDATHASLARLTERQQTILRLLGQGLSSADIGDRLGLSENTITFHRRRIRTILGLASEWELMRQAILIHLATDGDDAAKKS